MEFLHFPRQKIKLNDESNLNENLIKLKFNEILRIVANT